MGTSLLSIAYILASVSFILGLKMLSDPATARRGNGIAAAGMTIAVLATILLYRNGRQPLHHYGWMFTALVIGGIAGTLAAKKVRMTAMPEMVSLFNGMGGACAAIISLVEIQHRITAYDHPDFAFVMSREATLFPFAQQLAILFALVIGSVSFAGSMIAWGKLNGRIKDITFKGQHLVNLILLFIILLVALFFLREANPFKWPVAIMISMLSLLYGILFVLPIGGADMPVVISVLNSFTGVAAACGGFLYDNKAMLTGGILVGAAGTVLTILMCKAMNRSLRNVLIGAFGSASPAAPGRENASPGTYREIALSDAAMLLSYAHKVMIVPGYGLAVAQAQHTCHELENLLSDKGVEVKYAIHPVAGRMPGHMNVLLAEADVSYDLLLELEQANAEFPSTDVVVVLGANDVVNPAAKTDPSSPIYGMPILDIELAKACIVNKRSMKPGYAGIENDLFFRPKTSMLFGDAKKALQDLIAEIKNL